MYALAPTLEKLYIRQEPNVSGNVVREVFTGDIVQGHQTLVNATGRWLEVLGTNDEWILMQDHQDITTFLVPWDTLGMLGCNVQTFKKTIDRSVWCNPSEGRNHHAR